MAQNTPKQSQQQSSPSSSASQTPSSSGVGAQSARTNSNGQSSSQGQGVRPGGPFSASDLNRIVLEYLNKKGYHRTEAMLRAESGRTLTPQNKQSPANTRTGRLPDPRAMPPSAERNARPVSNPVPSKRDADDQTVVSVDQLRETTSPESYIRAFSLLRNWTDSSLEFYKPELLHIIYPIFIYLFLSLVPKSPLYARRFFDRFSPDFKISHGSEINRLFSVNSIDHIKENEVANAFQTNRYRVTISRTTLNLLLYFLNENEGVGGSLIISIINQHLEPNIVDRVTSKDTLADGIKIIESENGKSDITSEINSTVVKLGPFPKDEEFSKEVETELKIKDEQDKRQAQQDTSASDRKTLLQEYREMNNEPYNEANNTNTANASSVSAPNVKEEEEENNETKEGEEGDATKEKSDTSNIPPAPKAGEKKQTSQQQAGKVVAAVPKDAMMESPSISSLPLPAKTSLDLKLEIQKVKESRDAIRLDDLQLALPSVCMYTFHNTNRDMTCLEFSDDCRMAACGFQDSQIKIFSLDGSSLDSKLTETRRSGNKLISNEDTTATMIGHSGTVYSTSFSPDTRYLVSASEDKTVRLWSMDTYTSLVSYKGHNHPVWDVEFSPLGHYFATASHDHTARLWSCDHIYPLRIFAGHLNDVDCVSFHPNGCYVFTGSSDKTCRMWDITTGESVRLFLGLSAPVISTRVSPDGRWLSTGSEDGVINVWDIGTGKRLKQMRGHGKNAIYSLSYNKEGNVLISGGADHSVRVWDLKKATTESGAEPEEPFVGYAGDVTASINQDIKEYGRRRTVIPTNDLVASFYTKKTPVFKVKFTRSNLALAGGAFRD
ncbi:hypothetical protein HG537_0C01030 [Torulaspora globosa]|uniref:TFIID subunit TAF5 NTD2 domain-containing protein n=1 Tax=Torulaspora globosa TaxID=48254 RepID=A0A7H9HQH5_9SACH|nr:hypothetical protein HG537_0C01030 [Torulaspora sp. CBS 2947]